MPASQLTISGTLQTYENTNEDGSEVYVRRRFCGSCGSPIVSEMMQPGCVVAVKAGTLDDRSDLRPMAEVCCVDPQPSVALPGLPLPLAPPSPSAPDPTAPQAAPPGN